MARPRTPTAKLELTGAFKRNPSRGRARANEPKPNTPLGQPPSEFNDSEKAIWFELKRIAPDKVLTGADRWLVEVCCKIMARLRSEGIGGRYGVTVGEVSQLMQGLSRMGLTPADRSRISIPREPAEDNPFAEIAEDNRDSVN